MKRTGWSIVAGAGAAALALAGPANAEWRNFMTTVRGTTYATDADRMKQIGNRYHIWIKADHSHDQSERARTSMTLMSIDCPSKTTRILSYTGYDTYGKVTLSQSYTDYYNGEGYEPITPETMPDKFAIVLCAPPKGAGQ